MPYIPHTLTETSEMLDAVGIDSLDALFNEVPSEFRAKVSKNARPGLSEMAVRRQLQQHAAGDLPLCFAGAGAYEHHIPAPVWHIASRGEYATAYTPYQAEASQGTLQVLYEYQTMLCRLTGMEVANASLYDGATALMEAVHMVIRSKRKPVNRILVPRALHPAYRQVLDTFLPTQAIAIQEVEFDSHSGMMTEAALSQAIVNGADALVLPLPNYFGALEAVDLWVDWAHDHGVQVIAVVNPMILGIVKPPSQWGKLGADLVCGEGQPLGLPLSSGGPYLGFLCCRQSMVRQLPGRIVGRTVDCNGDPGFVLTLQAREQHIRRGKATSNICTNQGWMATAATIYMALMGDAGIAATAQQSHQNAIELSALIEQETGLKPRFNGPFFHEFVLTLPCSVAMVQQKMRAAGILAGVSLCAHYPECEQSLMICVTETKTAEDLAYYASTLARVLGLRPTPTELEREVTC